jgi:hypothetical protein
MADEIDDGGPAFPHYRQWEDRKGYTETDIADGMTLRDYFAAKAMAALLCQMLDGDVGMYDPNDPEQATTLAHLSYQAADAMLKARGEK